MIILGIDPGIADLGIAVLRVEQGKRIALDTMRLHTSPSGTDLERLSWLVGGIRSMIGAWQPVGAIGVESYCWQGAKRSANENAFRLSWAVGFLSGALMTETLFEVTRNEALRAVGCRTEQGASRLMRAMHPSAAKASQHELDALMVAHCVAAREGAPKLRRMGL